MSNARPRGCWLHRTGRGGMNHDETNGPQTRPDQTVISTANSGLACLLKQRDLRLFCIAEVRAVGSCTLCTLSSGLNVIKEEK